jgi:hypothetical protein
MNLEMLNEIIKSQNRKCIKYLLLFYCIFQFENVSFSQLRQEKVFFSVGGQYIQPQNELKKYVKFGVGLDVITFWELNFLKDNLLAIGIGSFNLFNQKKNLDDISVKTSIQFMPIGLGYQLKKISFGGGYGLTVYNDLLNPNLGTKFLYLGFTIGENSRIVSKYIFNRSKEYGFFDYNSVTKINYDNFTIGFYQDILKSRKK